QPADQREQWLRTYHAQRADALKKGEVPPSLVAMDARVYVSKGKIERPVELALAGRTGRIPTEAPTFEAPEDLASWQALVEDTQVNEKARRLLIHNEFVERSAATPQQVCKWLYREVLHADLDDPYLGLGKVLFASDPFRKAEPSR